MIERHVRQAMRNFRAALRVSRPARSTSAGTAAENSAAEASVPGFNEAWYVAFYPDIAAAIARGDIQSGLEHYLKSGRQEGRFPSPNYQVPLDVPAIEVEVTVEPDLAATLLAHVEQTWNQLGQEQPHWSVLSADQFKPDRIAEHEDDFYASGAADTNMLLAVLRRNGFAPERFARVLEYGCGLGRVTAHLASAFPAVIACDISQSHLLQAKQTLARTGTTNAEFRLVSLPEFGMHNSFDLWFSRIVLQHNPPPVIAMILGRALACLAPGGLAVFQVPTYAIGYRFRANEYLRSIGQKGEIEMHVLPQRAVLQVAQQAGCVLLELREDIHSAGHPAIWLSNLFVIWKPA